MTGAGGGRRGRPPGSGKRGHTGEDRGSGGKRERWSTTVESAGESSQDEK